MNLSEKTTAGNLKAITYLIGFLSFVLFVYILMVLKDILIPVTIAIFLTFLFHPILTYFSKFKIPKWVSIIFIFIVLVVINYLLVLIIISNIDSSQARLQYFSDNLSQFIKNILEPFNLTLKQFLKMLGIGLQDLNFGNLFQRLFASGTIGSIFNSLTSILGDVFISMIFWLFMILGKEKFDKRLEFAFAGRSENIIKSITNIDHQLQSYIFIKSVLSIIMGIIATVIFFIYGIDFAILWGLLTIILNFIPNIGATIASIIPILISLIEYGMGFRTISMGIILLIVHNVIGSVLEPHYMGKQMDLSPVFILFSLIFWGWIWGIPGMFLAVPIAASMKILFSNVEPLKPLSILMGTKATTEGPKTHV